MLLRIFYNTVNEFGRLFLVSRAEEVTRTGSWCREIHVYIVLYQRFCQWWYGAGYHSRADNQGLSQICIKRATVVLLVIISLKALKKNISKEGSWKFEKKIDITLKYKWPTSCCAFNLSFRAGNKKLDVFHLCHLISLPTSHIHRNICIEKEEILLTFH